MKLPLFAILTFLCFLPYASVAKGKDDTLASKIELILKTNVKYIDRNNNAKKAPCSIKFEVFIINKTKQDLVISSDDNDLRFFINYKSTKNGEFLKKPLFNMAVIFFAAWETASLNAESYSKVEFEYQVPDSVLSQYIAGNKYNIFQGWCEYFSGGKIKSNTVNIPIISLPKQGAIEPNHNPKKKSDAKAPNTPQPKKEK